ncbi:MAG: hypothetical protein OHK0045_15230 [Raineya sp.]
MRYDFVVRPGADPSQIRFKLEGQNASYVKKGNLCFTTRFGEVQMAELKTYQAGDKKEVASHFKQAGKDMYSISVAHYDPTQTLIIDPLIYSTYIGGSNDEWGHDIAIDGSGNAYVMGTTNSINYDITPGAFQTTYGGGSNDVFVTKLDATGSSLVYSTYIGGSGSDYGHGIAIDGSGNAYVTGYTNSTDYDITSGAFQTTYGGGNYDVFVTKLCTTCTPLPIELIAFQAVTQNNQVTLLWQTASEINVSHFEIEKSVTGLSFTTIGKIESLNSANSYQYIDRYLQKGTLYYRLKIVDKDGRFSYSQIKEVFIEGSNEKFVLYPNPNKGQFVIQSEKRGMFELTDITGKVINTYTMQTTSIEVNENLPAGMYFVREKTSGHVQKLIIE